MKTIGLVILFFGKWPRWGDLFLESCRLNPTVDVFLVTDCAAPRQKASGNIKIVDLDFTQFKALASERLGVQINYQRPYKACDLRPALGMIFEDLLKGYDFWGYCDLDVIFGDIRSFMTDEVLESYDIITARKEFIAGHFTLFRNVSEVNRLYERSRDHLKVFTTEALNYNFEECGNGLQLHLIKGAKFSDLAAQAKVDSLTHIVMRSPEIRVHLKTICDEYLPRWAGFGGDVQIFWENGKMVKAATGEPIMYYHINFLKEVPSFYIPRWKELPPAFRITRQGFFWIGEEPLSQRVADAVQRKLHFVVTFVRSWSWELLHLVRSRIRKWRAPSAVPAP